MKSKSRAMAITGWIMTIAGSGTVIFWVLYEGVTGFRQAPVATVVSVFIVLLLMVLLVPVPLWLATRRARVRRASR
jgi:hypothetical protein